MFNQKYKQSLQIVDIDDRPDEEEIISMAVSQDETRVAAALGRISHGADETITCLIVYEYVQNDDLVEGSNKKHTKKLYEIYRRETRFDKQTSTEFKIRIQNMN